MEKKVNKPFYFHPPWNILFDLERLQKINPWDISISFLLLSFLDEMDRRAEIDFRASGVALDSSATVYLMKSRLLLQLEEPPASPVPKLDYVPPPLILPLRYELTTTTIQNLMEALDEALQSEKLFSLRTPLKSILPPPEVVPTISVYLMELEKQIEKLVKKMRSLAEKGEMITFSKLVLGLEKLEKIRTFIILLFVAQKGTVTLWQDENFNEIFITLNGEVNS